MKALVFLHSERMHVALLYASARLAPEARREEWLVEWRTELWHAWHVPSPRPEEITAFCFGAFKDALWLRKNDPLPRAYGPLLIETRRNFPTPPPAPDSRFLESPGSCLAMLGFLAAMCVALRLFLPAARHDERHLVRGFLVLFGWSWLIVPVTTRLSLGDYPAGLAWARRWIFFAAKIALIALVVVLSASLVASSGSIGWLQIAFWIDFWGGNLAIRWALSDQRRRCPVCLRRLANPVRMGDRSRILLEWSGTELMCRRGHGLLHVPEEPAIWFHKQRWLYFDSSWNRLFPHTKH